jgi:tripartite-type tricarboxylate transporter receptor subunit TctC
MGESIRVGKGEGIMDSKKAGIRLLLAGVFFLATSVAGWAQNYPVKPIRMIVPFAAGGSADLVGRALSKPLSKELKVNVMVENIPAGSTKVGTLEVIKADPDGYTLMFAAHKALMGYYYSGTHSSRVWEQMVLMGQSGEQPYGFFEARIDAPFKSWGELVRFAKQNPGKLTCGGPGAGGMMNLIVGETAKAAGIEVRYVPFAGAGPSGTALLGGHVDYRVCSASEALPNIRGGKTRGLAISNAKRIPELPDVPGFEELGIAFVDFPLTLSFDLWGPPKLPKDIQDLLAKALEKSVKDPGYIQFVQRLCYSPTFLDSEGVREKIRMFDEKIGPKLAAFYKQ